MERPDQRHGLDHDGGEGRAGGEWLVEVQQVESIIPDRTEDPQLGRGIRRYRRQRSVLGVRHGVTERGHPRLGRQAITRRKDLDIDSVTPQGPG